MGGERPLKAYGERRHLGPFRIFSSKLNCEAYTYARGCAGRTRRGTPTADQCVWCFEADVCVSGFHSSGPDARGLRALAAKGVRCDRWQSHVI